MVTVVVPVRFPLSKRSRRTLREGRRITQERDGRMTVLHINLYQTNRRTTPSELKRTVERELGYMPRTRFAVRDGFILEETLIEEIKAEQPDILVLGEATGGIRGFIRRVLFDEPDIMPYLNDSIDCEIVTVT